MTHPLILIAVAAALSAPGVAAQSHAPPITVADSARASLLKRAEAAYAARRWEEAAQLYQSALGDDRSPAYRWELAHALLNARRHREAIAAFEHALQLGAGDPAVGSWNIARAYLHEGNWKQALRWLGHAVDAGFDARDAATQEPLFQQFRGDPRFSALADSSAQSRGSACRRAVTWTRQSRAGEVGWARSTVPNAGVDGTWCSGARGTGAAGFEPATSRVTAGRSAN